MRVFSSAVLMLLATAVAGCSDPASEQPVSLKPGLYQVTMGSAFFGSAKTSGKSAADNSQCVVDGSDLEWMYPLIKRQFCPECTCSTTDKTRTGNAISARLVCPADEEGTMGTFEYAYQGVVSEDRVTLEGSMKAPVLSYVDPDASEAEKAEAAEARETLESATLAARIERIGDCPA